MSYHRIFSSLLFIDVLRSPADVEDDIREAVNGSTVADNGRIAKTKMSNDGRVRNVVCIAFHLMTAVTTATAIRHVTIA